MSEPYWSALGARAGDGGVDYEGVWSNAVAYLAGDVVLHNGVNYLAVNPSTGVQPGPTFDAGFGTSLPISPVDGMEFTLVDSLTAPTYSWKFRYVAAKASNKWVFIGGAPALVFVDTAAESISNTAYVNLATVGPSFTVPVAGDYEIQHGAGLSGNAAMTARMSYDLGATGASDNDSAWVWLSAASQGGAVTQTRKKALAAATAIVCKYRCTASTANFERRWLQVIPIAVGG